MFAAGRATVRRGDNAAWRHHGRTPNLGFKTIVEAAQEAGVSTGAVDQAKAIRRDAAPEVVKAVEAGRLTLHSAEPGGGPRRGRLGSGRGAPSFRGDGMKTLACSAYWW